MLKMGIIGGGPGSMIGDVHRVTAEATGKAELVCGAFSSDINKSLEKGMELGLPTSRIYLDIDTMIAGELTLPMEDRMNFLAITTPNHLHVDAAIKALEAGFNVMCDKPLAINLVEAKRLQRIVEKSQLKFGVTYTYRGYAAIQQIAKMVQEGSIGSLRKLMVDYSQGWLSQLVENKGNKQASWRTDPKFSGIGGTIADIGTHAFNMAEYVANERVGEMIALVSTLVKGRKIDDDANVLLKFKNGATGTLSVSQVCTGEGNTLSLQVYGDKGGLLWNHSQPKEIIYRTENEEQIIEVHELDVDIRDAASKLPTGHPESFLKAFINIYDDFIESINTGRTMPYPNIVDGVRGMMFIEKAIESSEKRAWTVL